MTFSKINIRSLVFILLFFVFNTLPYNAFCQNLYFAGFSFLGNANQDFRYPVAARLFDENPTIFKSPLDKALLGLKRKDLNFIKELGTIQSGEAVTIAFALTDESIERFSSIDGVTNAYKIYAQILVFDFNEKKVITNYPVLVQKETVTNGVPSTVEDFNIVKNMYLDISNKSSIFKFWTEKLETVKLLNAGSIHLQIRDVKLDGAVINQIPEKLSKNNLLKVRSAQKLEYHISSKQNVPILPFTLGQIGNFKKGLIARFSDSLEYDLTLPEADYVMDLTVREFKNITVDRGKFEVKIYAAFITLDVLEPLTNTSYVNSKFDYKNELVFPKSENIQILNEWDVYQRTQDALFSNLAKQISKRDDAVLPSITGTANIKSQLAKFEGIINKCK